MVSPTTVSPATFSPPHGAPCSPECLPFSPPQFRSRRGSWLHRRQIRQQLSPQSPMCHASESRFSHLSSKYSRSTSSPPAIAASTRGRKLFHSSRLRGRRSCVSLSPPRRPTKTILSRSASNPPTKNPSPYSEPVPCGSGLSSRQSTTAMSTDEDHSGDTMILSDTDSDDGSGQVF